MENNLKNQHYKNMSIKPQMEILTFEAESVAFVVCNHFGLDTSDYSFGYLAGWSSNRELPELKSSLQTIQKTAHDLIDRMEEEMLHLSKQIECSENLDATRLSHVEASNIHHHRR